jgi:hypothetical protein
MGLIYMIFDIPVAIFSPKSIHSSADFSLNFAISDKNKDKFVYFFLNFVLSLFNTYLT